MGTRAIYMFIFTYLYFLVEEEIYRNHIRMRYTSRFTLLASELEYLPRILVFISFELGQTPLETWRWFIQLLHRNNNLTTKKHEEVFAVFSYRTVPFIKTIKSRDIYTGGSFAYAKPAMTNVTKVLWNYDNILTRFTYNGKETHSQSGYHKIWYTTLVLLIHVLWWWKITICLILSPLVWVILRTRNSRYIILT